jgi:hypothetical protein
MDRDSFVVTLISQYKEEIEEILVECEFTYRSSIDYQKLETKIDELFRSAHIDGLDEKIVWDLIHYRIPSYINYMNAKTKPLKKAA